MSVARALFCTLILCLLIGCSEQGASTTIPKGVPIVRVRLQQDCHQVKVASTSGAWVKSSSDMGARQIRFPSVGTIVRIVNGSWDIGGIPGGTGELTISPNQIGAVTIDSKSFRGRYRLVPVTADTFDVVNDVDVDSYLKGVIAVELYPGWEEETYKAQAIAARTYAIYESRTAGQKRYWDIYADQRSQVYMGVGSETSKSAQAVDGTAGTVVAYGPAGQEKIFKAYFSSCCGGKTQSDYDAFGEEYIPPLAEYDRGATCSISPKFNWGPVTIRKDELSRRMAAWAKYKTEQTGTPRPELKMQGISRIEQAFVNKLGRPVYFYITDNQGTRFLMRAEDLRTGITWDAGKGSTVYSGFFKTVNEPESIKFVDGHGYGHGVGLCQWCAQRQAQSGWRHENILLSAYPQAKLIRAY